MAHAHKYAQDTYTLRTFASMHTEENIVALASPAGIGAIAVIRVSGPDSIKIVSNHFESVKGKVLLAQKSHTIHLGYLKDGAHTIDKVLVSLFKGPNSYTGEDVVEISCHGSWYIQNEIINLMLRNGCRMATEGEFTLRAFLNGKMDLSQAEAVADLIASDSKGSHQLAMKQMRGGFSNEIERLRQELLNFASLIELELDFSQEDVEFADRSEFNDLLKDIGGVLKNLIDSFALGNVLKNGIPVAIIGRPNVGKSTLLNTLLNEERAIVSDIPGTTRDVIEDQLNIGGQIFRFIDTAGLRTTADTIEQIGIERALQKIDEAQLIIHLFDATQFDIENIVKIRTDYPEKTIIEVANKVDRLDDAEKEKLLKSVGSPIILSAKLGYGVDDLKSTLLQLSQSEALGNSDIVVSNSRHYEALNKALTEIRKVKSAMDEDVPSDLLAIDIRQALFHLGEITGKVTTDDLLGNIFSNFCIGK